MLDSGRVKAKVDPAHFIVRRESYSQLKGYPEACASITQELLQHPPKHFPEVFELIRQRMTESPLLNRDGITHNMKGFGQERGNQPHRTELNSRFSSDADEFRKRHGSGVTVEFTHSSIDPRAKPIALSRIENRPAEFSSTLLTHPPVGPQTEGQDEDRWAQICQKYEIAMEKRQAKPERELASLQCYALLSHDCPLRRGSSTLSRIVLQFLAQEVDFPVPLAKIDVDYNTKASTRPVEEFVTQWKQGEYFDSTATAEDVMGWHRRRAQELPSMLRL